MTNTNKNEKANTPETNEKFTMSTVDNTAFAVLAAGQGEPIRETTTTDTATLFNALSGGSKPIKDVLGKELEIVDIVVTSVDVNEDREDETSPMINRPVVHFFTANGEHYSTLSNGVVRTTKNLLACGLVPTKETPLKIKFDTVETKKGTAHIFELV